MSKKGRKMPEDVNLKDISAQIEKLSAAVQDLQKKADGDKASDKGSYKEPETDLSDLAALLPLFGFMPLGFGGSLLFPLGLRMGAARALALGHALERAAKVSSQLGKEHGGSAGMPEIMRQFFKLSLTSEEQQKFLEVMKIWWKAAASSR